MSSPAPKTEWLTVAEVADLHDISVDVVYKRIRARQWDGFVTRFGKLKIDRAGLEQWLRSGGDLCRSDSDHHDQARANTGAPSSHRQPAGRGSARRNASEKQKLERLLSAGIGMPPLRVIK